MAALSHLTINPIVYGFSYVNVGTCRRWTVDGGDGGHSGEDNGGGGGTDNLDGAGTAPVEKVVNEIVS